MDWPSIVNISMIPKFFVRYTNGSGGHYICALAWGFITNFVNLELMKSPGSDKKHIFEQYQNCEMFMDYGIVQRTFAKYTNEHFARSQQAVEWFKNFVKFSDSPWPAYVSGVHAVDPTALLTAIPNSRLINIQIDEDDIDQLVWNWVIKAFTKLNYHDKNKHCLGYLKKLKSLNIDIQTIDFTDLRQVAWAEKYCQYSMIEQYTKAIDCDVPMLNLDFKSIHNGNLHKKIDELADFLEVGLTDHKRLSAKQMINNYYTKQINVPYTLKLDDY